MNWMVIDDDRVFGQRLLRALQDREIPAAFFENIEHAQNALAEAQPTHIVLDLKMPNGSGLEFLSANQDALAKTKVVILSGYGSISNAVEATKLGAVNFISKPATMDEIFAAFESEPTHDLETPSLARVEWEHIQRVLDECDGNITHAAEKLGLHRRTLQRKLSKYPPKA